MYLYFNKEGKLQTQIAHGSPVRQGDSFGLFVCFDLDYFDGKHFTGNEILSYCYQRPGDTTPTTPIMMEYKGAKTFVKLYDSEVTYKLKNNERYLTYYANVPSNVGGFTEKTGDVQVTFVIDILNANNENETITLDAKVYVEPTYKKIRPKIDDTIASLTNYQDLVSRINTVAASKNIALDTDMTYNTINEEPDEYATQESRADYIYTTWHNTRQGWLIVGVKSNYRQEQSDLEPQNVEIQNTDLYMILDGQTMLVIDGITGIIYNYDATQESGEKLTQLSYDKIYFDTLLGEGLQDFLDTNYSLNPDVHHALLNLKERLDDIDSDAIFDVTYESGALVKKVGKNTAVKTEIVSNATLKEDLGINDIEEDSIYDVKYENGSFKKKVGKNAEGYTEIVDNATLRNNLGVASLDREMSDVKTHGTYDINYSGKALKAKVGFNNSEQTIVNTNTLKEDMDLDNVDNKASSNIISDTLDYVATVKAVFDTLEKGALGSIDQNTNTSNYNEMMRRIRYMYQYFSENQSDVDDKIDKLEEIINVLDNLPENYNIFEIITDIYNRIGENEEGGFFYNSNWPNADKERYSIKGRISELENNADSHIMIFMRFADNQQLFTIPIENWLGLSEPNTNYPSAAYYVTIQNDTFKNALDMEIIFDKESEQTAIIASDLDIDTGVLTLYAASIPEEIITINTIKIISNLYHTTTLSLAALNQINENKNNIIVNTNNISNLTRDKQDKSNLVNEWSSTPSQAKYPSEALVKSELDDINNTKLPEYLKKYTQYTKDGKVTTQKVLYAQPNSSNISTLKVENEQLFETDGGGNWDNRARLNLKTDSIQLFWRYGTDANNYKNHQLNIDTDGFDLKYYEKSSGVANTHSLTFDANGDLKADGAAYVKETNAYSAGRYIKTIENKNNSSEILISVVDTNDYSHSIMSVSGEAVNLEKSYQATANKNLISNVSLQNGKTKIVNSTWESGEKTAEHTLEFDEDGNLTLDGNAVGSKLYQHNIHFRYQDVCKFTLTLINSSDTKINSFATLKQALIDKGYFSNSKYPTVNWGEYDNSGTPQTIVRITDMSTTIQFYIYNGYSGSGVGTTPTISEEYVLCWDDVQEV